MDAERAAATAFAARMEQRFLMHSPQGPASGAVKGEAVEHPSPASATATQVAVGHLSMWLAAMAAGYLIALCTLPGANPAAPSVATPLPPAPLSPPVAQLVMATGGVEVRPVLEIPAP